MCVWQNNSWLNLWSVLSNFKISSLTRDKEVEHNIIWCNHVGMSSTLFWLSWSDLGVVWTTLAACWTENSEEIPRWKWNYKESTGTEVVYPGVRHECTKCKGGLNGSPPPPNPTYAGDPVTRRNRSASACKEMWWSGCVGDKGRFACQQNCEIFRWFLHINFCCKEKKHFFSSDR